MRMKILDVEFLIQLAKASVDLFERLTIPNYFGNKLFPLEMNLLHLFPKYNAGGYFFGGYNNAKNRLRDR